MNRTPIVAQTTTPDVAMNTTVAPSWSGIEKDISETDGEYFVYVAGEFVGARRFYHQAEQLADEAAWSLLKSGALR